MSEKNFYVGTTPGLVFSIDGDEYRQSTILEPDFMEFFVKNSKYMLFGGNGEYKLWDLETDKELGAYDHLIASGEVPTNLIDASIAGFNMLNSLLGDESITDGGIEIYCDDVEFLENVKESYYKDHVEDI